MGKIDEETLQLPNECRFNTFKTDAAFSYSDGNFEDAIGKALEKLIEIIQLSIYM
tara:strand:+ start:240 stop:404 length:165 start_codon:yes stop_codon:yes gene_type:complete